MGSEHISERVQTVVIGAGQAGLTVGYHLARRGLSFVILDANERVGDAWRHRWDSLRLFTPARFDGLDGMPFPAPKYSFPTKDQMADYLEAYTRRFALPVRTGVRVNRVSREGRRYVVSAGARQFEADHVVIAMASYQRPKVPPHARELSPQIVQMHSNDYRSPSQLEPGGVLIVGAGNSGAEIAIEVARDHPVWISGRDVGQVPFRIANRAVQRFLVPVLFRVVFHRILTVKTPMGRKARPAIISKGALLIRTRREDLASAGVERVPRLTGVRNGMPVLEDGRVLEVANVIWCTGFDGGFSWIDLPSRIIDDHGEPIHDSGIVRDEPGLYFVGLHFLYSMSSTMIHGIGRDAQRIVAAIATRARAEAPMGHQAVAAVS